MTAREWLRGVVAALAGDTLHADIARVAAESPLHDEIATLRIQLSQAHKTIRRQQQQLTEAQARQRVAAVAWQDATEEMQRAARHAEVERTGGR